MGLTSFMLNLYKWEALRDRNLLEMNAKVDRQIDIALDLSTTGPAYLARKADKKLDELYEGKAKIDAEMKKRGLL